MIDAISSLISNTIDVFLKLNSPERKRNNLGKLLFETYSLLDEIVSAMDRIKKVVGAFIEFENKKMLYSLLDFNLPDHVVVVSHGGGEITMRTRLLSKDGRELLSRPKTFTEGQLLNLALENDIRTFYKAVSKLEIFMYEEADFLSKFLPNRNPVLLKALGIYDEELVWAMVHAWHADGGFVECLLRLGFKVDLNRKVLRLLDAHFDPKGHTPGYQIEPVDTAFSLVENEDVQELLRLLEKSQESIIIARDKVRSFLAQNYKIEDII
jgi:hypothetical protein